MPTSRSAPDDLCHTPGCIRKTISSITMGRTRYDISVRGLPATRHYDDPRGDIPDQSTTPVAIASCGSSHIDNRRHSCQRKQINKVTEDDTYAVLIRPLPVVYS
jgi:hypothetical protein